MWQVSGLAGMAQNVSDPLDQRSSTSELHVFRGHQPSPTGFIMGHEFTGHIEEAGSAVKSFKKGDKIVAPFTLSWFVPIILCSQFSHRLSDKQWRMLLL